MREKYSQLLVTKLKPTTHERLKYLALNDRRSLSSLCRIIVEDYVNKTLKEGDKTKDTS